MLQVEGAFCQEQAITHEASCGVQLTRLNTLRMSCMQVLASGPPMTPKAHKQLACCLWLKLCRHRTLAQVLVGHLSTGSPLACQSAHCKGTEPAAGG